MNEQEQDIAEIKQGINGLANMYGDLVFELEKANKSKLPNGATVLLIGKDNQALDKKTIEYFVKHNEQIRKETAKKILQRMYDVFKPCDSDLCDLVKFYAKEWQVEVE